MILTKEESEFLDKLVTCPRCRSKAVEIVLKENNVYFKRCLKCGYEEELRGIEWD